MRTRTEGSTSSRGSARKSLIIEIATRHFSRNGSRGTTLAQIAAESGVSQPGLLYYFPTKDHLLHAVLDARDSLEGRNLWSDQINGLDLLDVMVKGIDGWSRQPDAVGMHTVLVAENVGQDGPLRPRLSRRYLDTIERISGILESAQDSGLARSDFDPRLKAMELVAFINGLETAWLLNPDLPVSEVAEQWANTQKELLTAPVPS